MAAEVVDVLTLIDKDGFGAGDIGARCSSFEWAESLSASGASMTCDPDLARLFMGPGAASGVAWHDVGTGHVWTAHVAQVSLGPDEGRVTFNSDLTLLRWVFPHPSPIDLNPATQSHDVLTGAAGSVLGSLIDRNCGPAAHVSRRRFAAVTLSNTAGTPATTVRARWSPHLLEWVARKGTPNGVAVSVTRSTLDGTYGCLVRGVATLERVFSDQHFAEWELTETAPQWTHVTAGGSGLGTARLIASGSAPDGWRREKWLDRRSVAVSGELSQEIVEDLASGRRKSSLSAVLVEPHDFRYGRDFRLGDLARLRVAGVELLEPVTEVRSTLTDAGVDRLVTVGVGPIVPGVGVEARRTAAALDDLTGED